MAKCEAIMGSVVKGLSLIEKWVWRAHWYLSCCWNERANPAKSSHVCFFC